MLNEDSSAVGGSSAFSDRRHGCVLLCPDATVTGTPALLTVTTSSIPKSDTQEVRILTATLPPGATSTWHTHPSPPFVYVIEGAMIEVNAGRAIAEPTGEVIRAVNRGTVPTKLVIFYVAPPRRTPFLEDPARAAAPEAAGPY